MRVKTVKDKRHWNCAKFEFRMGSIQLSAHIVYIKNKILKLVSNHIILINSNNDIRLLFLFCV